MRRLKNVLVALDGSPLSFHALEESIRLAQWGKGRVTAITVAPSYEGDLSLVGVKNIRDAIDGPSEDILEKAMEMAEAHGAPIKVICEEGEAHRKIVEHAQAEGSELIVLGASNRTSIARILLGSVGSRVIEHSPRDVLMIPEKAAIAWERILLVADGSEYGQSAKELALELAVSYGGELKTVFLSMGSSGEASKAFNARAEQIGIRCDVLEAKDHADRIVHHLAKEQAVKLIILGVQMKKRLLGLLRGNIADSFIGCSYCPVLVVKARHDAAETLGMKSLLSAVRL